MTGENSCRHIRVCGDGLVERTFPDFFATHARSESGSEWQVCRLCGDAKQIQLNYGTEMEGPVMSSLKEWAGDVKEKSVTRRKEVEGKRMGTNSNGHASGLGVASKSSGLKVCERCGKAKPMTHFKFDGRTLDGRHHLCLDCRPCKHHFLCGDRIIASHFPDFFLKRAPTKRNLELQVCRECGTEKTVKLFDLNQGMEGIVEHNRLAEVFETKAAPTNDHTPDEAPVIAPAMEDIDAPVELAVPAPVPAAGQVETRVCVSCGKTREITEFQRKYGSEERRDKCKKCGQGARAKKEEDAPAQAPWPGREDFERKLEQLAGTLRPPSISPMVKARAVKALLEENEWLTQTRLAQLLDTSQSSIARYMQVLELPETVLAFVEDGSLTMGHAAALTGVRESESIELLAGQILAKGLSVRETEDLVRSHNESPDDGGEDTEMESITVTGNDEATALAVPDKEEPKNALTVLFDDWQALNSRADAAEVLASELQTKYDDAQQVMKQQKQLIDALSTRITGTLKLLATTTRRARLAELDLQIYKLQAERDAIADGDGSDDELAQVA